MRVKSVILVLIYAYVAFAQDPVVELEYGKVQGKAIYHEGKVISQFLGLPFATPPVGELRYKLPLPFRGHWETPFQAFDYGNPCTQIPYPVQLDKRVANQSEDCLYLNIWSPRTLPNLSSEPLKPVLAYAPGGAFYAGTASSDTVNGANLSARGDIVVVTLNYRLGPLGFLYANEDEAPGNAGLWDQLLAFQWVKDNIRYFGGDPNQITIGGQSAGSISIGLHVLSPYSRNIYQKAMMVSGANYNMFSSITKSLALKRSTTLAQLLGCRKYSGLTHLTSREMKCMRNVDAEVLVQTQFDQRVVEGSNFEDLWPFRPIYGDLFTPISPTQALQDGHFNRNTSILIGATTNEALVFMLLYGPLRPGSPGFGQQHIGLNFEAFNDLMDQKDHYEDIANSTWEAVTTNAYCSIRFQAEQLSYYNDVYQYQFSYPAPSTFCESISYRPCHGDDVKILFGTPLTNPADIAASGDWMDFVSTFVKGDKLPVRKYTWNNRRLLAPYYQFRGYNNHEAKVGLDGYVCEFWKAGILANMDPYPCKSGSHAL